LRARHYREKIHVTRATSSCVGIIERRDHCVTRRHRRQ
jgi:hypothetical protein